ncbi:MAG: YhbY family RNA-binding protein [Nitrosomonas sp.]|nr:YhbY family RNA-binding protein [Nitrosomonas sp.]
MLTLTVLRQRELKAQAHAINPIVTIGKFGLSPSVIEELDRGLISHELIKVKVQLDDRDIRKALFEEVCKKLDAAPVQHIGKIFIIYRPKPEEESKKQNIQPPFRKKHDPRRLKRSFQN